MNKRCLVAICHNGPVVFAETVRSLMDIGWGTRVAEAKQAHGFDAIDFTWVSAFPRVDSRRDAAVELARFEGVDAQGYQHEKYSHLRFLDADMTWPSDLLIKMLRHRDAGVLC